MKRNGKRKLNEYKKYINKKKIKKNKEYKEDEENNNESEDNKENNNENENNIQNDKKHQKKDKNKSKKISKKKIEENNSLIQISKESVGLFYKYMPEVNKIPKKGKNNNDNEKIENNENDKKEQEVIVNSNSNNNSKTISNNNNNSNTNNANTNQTNSINENKEEDENNNNKKNSGDEFLLSCLYDLFEGYDEILIKSGENKQYIINASIKVDEDKIIKFEIIYDKERDYFDYYPHNINFEFENDDEPFNYDLDIPKEDFCLLIKNFKKFKTK